MVPVAAARRRYPFVRPGWWAARLRFPLVLLLCVGLSLGVYFATYHHDNKYTRPASGANSGILRLDMEQYEADPLLFLVRGWEFYQYKLLTPEELAAHAPDTYLFIGQYGGFELGDRSASPHGSATYRLTVYSDGVERDFALELPEIYSAYRVWVNGDLKAAVGVDEPEDYRPATANRLIAFSARDKVEIVIAVTDYTHFYSGVTYPPAFGSPERVARMLNLRLAIRGVVLGVALLLGVLCLLLAVWQRFSGQTHLLALLCLCFIAYTAYPIVHTIPLTGEIWYDVEQIGYYAMFLVVVWLQGRLCGLPGRLYRPAVAVAALPCLSIPLYRHLWMSSAAEMYAYSRALSGYILLAGLYLLATTGWALLRGSRYSKPLLCGFAVFAAALVFDRAYPRFEPVLLGWHTEIAGFALVLVAAGIVGWDTALAYRERQTLREHRTLLEARVDLQLRQAEQERDYVERVHALRHESQNHYALLGDYLERGNTEQARVMLRELRGPMEEAPPAVRYCGNPLVNSILAVKLAGARRMGAAVEWTVRGLPERLPIADRDLMTALANILDNALEALEGVPGGERTLSLSIIWDGSGILSVACCNSCRGEREAALPTTKPDPRAHGLGLRLIREVAERYGGVLQTEHEADAFRLTLVLNPGEK